MKDKLLIIREVKAFIESLDEILINLPRREVVLKERFKKDSYDLLELVYMANQVELKDRHIYQRQCLTKISMLDYYLEVCFKKKYMIEKQVLKRSRKLLQINKMMYGWIYESKSK